MLTFHQKLAVFRGLKGIAANHAADVGLRSQRIICPFKGILGFAAFRAAYRQNICCQKGRLSERRVHGVPLTPQALDAAL